MLSPLSLSLSNTVGSDRGDLVPTSNAVCPLKNKGVTTDLPPTGFTLRKPSVSAHARTKTTEGDGYRKSSHCQFPSLDAAFLSICVVATCCRRHPVLHGARPTFRDRVYEPLPVPERKEAETEKPRPRTGKRDPTQFSRTPVPVRRSKA